MELDESRRHEEQKTRSVAQLQEFLNDPNMDPNIKQRIENEVIALIDKAREQDKLIRGSITEIAKSGILTKEAATALQESFEAANSLNHSYIGTEHILLGLISNPESKAGKVLANFDVTIRKVRTAINFIIGSNDRPIIGIHRLTPRAKKVIQLSSEEQHRLQDEKLDTDHLLLGILLESSGIAAGVLESLGITPEKVRAKVLELRYSAK